MQTLADQTIPRQNFFYFFGVCLSFFVFVVRPGEVFPVLAGTRLGLVSFVFTCVAFFVSSGPQAIREGEFPGLKLMQLLLFLGFLVIPFSRWPRHALEGWYTILLINTLLYFFWLPFVRSPHQLRKLVKFFVLAGGILALAILFLDFTQVTQYGRVSVGATYDPNDIAMVLAVVFPMNVAFFMQGKLTSKLFWGALLVCLVLGILSTGSRGGILSLTVACLLLLFTTGKRVKAWHKIFVVLLVAGFFMSPFADTVKERWQDVLSGVDYNIQNPEVGGVGRLSLWISGMQLIVENPLTGVGVSNTTNAMGIEFGRWRSLHNSYFQAGLELGLVGLVLFIMLLKTAWRNCSQALPLLDENHELRSFALLAVSARISIVTYITAAFFLSHAYSLILPILLLISNGLYYISEAGIKEGGS